MQTVCRFVRRAFTVSRKQRQSEGSRDTSQDRQDNCVALMQLLAKTAEERYQTAAGVEADLRRCLAEWEAMGRIDTFALGEHDTSDRLLMPEKLYGRDREREALHAAFDQVVASGTAALVLVSGYSGIGKSSIVHELHKAIVLPRGIFISGKFDQYKRDIPYATLAQAFRTFVRQILSESEAKVDGWRSAISEAVGLNGQLIVNLIPELEFVVGKQPPVAELPATKPRAASTWYFGPFWVCSPTSSIRWPSFSTISSGWTRRRSSCSSI